MGRILWITVIYRVHLLLEYNKKNKSMYHIVIMDMNIDDYTNDEMLQILGLSGDATDDEIEERVDLYIEKFVNTPQKQNFFIQMKNELLGEEDLAEQTDMWNNNEVLQQSDAIQSAKITDRVQKVDIYDNGHLPMKREQLGVNNTVSVPVAQDTLNPNLKNITTRIVNLDSQFRGTTGVSATDYTLDLSDTLSNVVSLRLYSIQIPNTWYVIDTQYGNTCFWVINNGNTFEVSIEPGNYQPDTFVSAINSALCASGFSNPLEPTWCNTGFGGIQPVTYSTITGKLTISLAGYLDPNGDVIVGIPPNTVFDSESDAYFLFFDYSGSLTCSASCDVRTYDSTLGWVAGFRSPIVPVFQSPGSTGVSVVSLFGSKYFIVVLDDYNQNHINNGLVTITNLDNRLNVPTYARVPHNCTLSGNSGLITVDELNQMGNSPNGDFKLDLDVGNEVFPTAPRTLTQAQIYTANEIIKNRSNTLTYRSTAPTCSDTFAIIPIKYSGPLGSMYTEFGGTMQDNKRVYFGPVDIDKMHLKLVDDKGFTVNLHGANWSLTLITENLYQY